MDRAGTLYNWDDDKGFGFITPDTGTREVFVHISAFRSSGRRPKNGDRLHYDTKTADGKSAAVDVRFENSSKADRLGLAAFKQRPIGSLIVGGWCLFYIIFVPMFIVAPLVISVITYAVYAKDKAAAQAEKQRTSEKFLHFLSLIGGWPGAFIAQTRLRHKLRKSSFMSMYWLTVGLNIAYIYWVKLGFVFNS